jgi:nucleoside-diphosphate-sugar epimerase
VLSRVLGDAGIAFIAVITAMIVQSYLVAPDAVGTAQALVSAMVPGGLVLVAVFVAAIVTANTLVGVYSRQRAYPMRTKLLRLVQSAAIAGAAAGVVLLLLPLSLQIPRAAFMGAWVLTALALPAARWWTWAYRIDVQARQLRQDMQLRAASDAIAIHQRRTAASWSSVAPATSAPRCLPRLLEAGKRVRLLDVFMYGKEPIQEWLDHPNLEVIEADYRKFDKLVEAMQDVDTVVHLGGLVGDPACAWNEALTVEVNLTFTRVIAEIAKASGVRRFVFASTCSVYGASDEILDESSQLNPVSLYARSKIGSERVLNQLQSPTFNVTILRFGTIYGISGRTRFDLVVNLLTAKAYVDGGITVFGGDQWRPFVHVADAAKAVAAVVDAPRSWCPAVCTTSVRTSRTRRSVTSAASSTASCPRPSTSTPAATATAATIASPSSASETSWASRPSGRSRAA